MINNPSVSVCIPVYNPGPYLMPAVGSVLAQSYQDFELLIVDDHSSQPVEEMLSLFLDTRIRFHQNGQNLGLASNWNRCVELSKGKYVTLFHQDDIMHPDNLLCKVSSMNANPRVGFVYSNIKQINASGQEVGGHWLLQPQDDVVLTGEELLAMVAETGNPISCPSVMVRQECFQQLGYFDIRLPFAVDLEMWLRIALKCDVAYLSEPLIYQRKHAKQETTRFQGTGRDYWDVLRAFDILRSNRLSATSYKLMSRAYRTLSVQSMRMARFKIRQGQILNGIRYSTVAGIALLRSIVTSSLDI